VGLDYLELKTRKEKLAVGWGKIIGDKE